MHGTSFTTEAATIPFTFRGPLCQSSANLTLHVCQMCSATEWLSWEHSYVTMPDKEYNGEMNRVVNDRYVLGMENC
jgi:hypothetical protein